MRPLLVFPALFCCVLSAPSANAAAWQPTKPVELIVPAGQGGGADQMARLIQKIVAKHKLMPQPIVVLNKTEMAGAEGFLLVKKNRGNDHLLIVTLSNLFTLPIAKGADFNWRDFTPISMMALDQFVLWVSSNTPYRSAKDYLDAARVSARPFKMGGTGSQQEDEIVTRALERAADVKFLYVPLGGGGEVAQALADQKIDSSVNNPIEAAQLWRLGKVRPLGVFDFQPIDSQEPVAGKLTWGDIPTMKSQRYDVEYLMLRGIFAAPEISTDARNYYVDVMRRVTQTPEWRAYVTEGALKEKFITANMFKSWLTFSESVHKSLLSVR